MDLIFGLIFSYIYSTFYYAIPINLIPIVILYSLKIRSFTFTLLFSLIMGIISDLIYPNKIWISPISYLILTYIISFLKNELWPLLFSIILWQVSFELLRILLDFKTNYIILIVRIILTSFIFLITRQYIISSSLK